MEEIIRDLTEATNDYVSELKSIEHEMDAVCASNWLFETFGESEVNPFFEKKKEEYTKTVSQISSAFFKKVTDSLKAASEKAHKKAEELLNKFKSIKTDSKKEVKMRPYDKMVKFYANCMKELSYIVDGPTMKDNFDSFVAKFSKKKAQMLEQEKKEREKCLTVAVSVATIGPFVAALLQHILSSIDEASHIATETEQKAKEHLQKQGIKTEAVEGGMTEAEYQQAIKMIESEFAKISLKLMNEYNRAVANATEALKIMNDENEKELQKQKDAIEEK